MIAVDADLLLYAYDEGAQEHRRAKSWLEGAFSSEPVVGLPLVSILAFLRIATDHRLSDAPRTPRDAIAIVDSWLARENICLLTPGSRHWQIFSEVLTDSNSTGARVTDAHLAALAIEHGATFCTNDRDFRRFPGLVACFPLLDG
jgi:toxin-antitoxin system PIN domain toxin